MGLLDLDWLRCFGALHECAKRGELADMDLASYRREREGIAAALLAAQQIALEPGQTARQSLRVTRPLDVTLQLHDRTVRTTALSVSAAGLAMVLELPPPLADEVQLTLAMPEGPPLRARARVADVRRNWEGSPRVRVSLQFVGLEEADTERLVCFVFDAILEHLQS